MSSLPFLTVGSTRIAYREANPGKENTIVFIHGNSGSSKAWDKQFESASLENYRLVAFDMPAHGQSSASLQPDIEFSLKGLGQIMALAVQSLLPEAKYILTGVSMGTNVIAEMLACGIKPGGLVLAGPCLTGTDYPLEGVFLTEVDTGFLFQDAPLPETVEKGYAAMAPAIGPDELQQVITDYFSVQPPFRSSLLQSVIDGIYSNEPEVVCKTGLPVLVVFGKDEKVVNPDYLDDAPFVLWKNKIIKLPGGHFIQLDGGAAFNNYLAEYANHAFGGSKTGS